MIITLCIFALALGLFLRAFGSVDDDNEANAQREMYARVKAEFGVE